MAKKNDPTKTSPPGKQSPERIAPSAVEISVARNGFLKPYATCFQQLPDNISREPLGLLAGVFSIGDRSEGSAYIVNFLASLAKKEYYGNPRRDAVESFESALHKVNVGLAELAKEGNTEWIGTLDAAVCAVERNNLHFSLAGNAKVLLFREGRLSDIGDGLSEDEGRHPMKTFTDVASGKVSPGDRVLITTPELFSATSELEIERSGNRLSGEPFERFLRTAAINKLDLSATILITIGAVEEYRRPLEPKRTLATVDTVPNAWSRAVFDASKRRGGSIEEELREKSEHRKDRVDDKTGHIYVTGELLDEESSEFLDRAKITLSDGFRSTLFFLRRSFSRGFTFIQSASQSLVHGIGKGIASIRERHSKKALENIDAVSSHSDITSSQSLTKSIREINARESTDKDSDVTVKASVVRANIVNSTAHIFIRFSTTTIRLFRAIPRSLSRKETEGVQDSPPRESSPQHIEYSSRNPEETTLSSGLSLCKRIFDRIAPLFRSVFLWWKSLPARYRWMTLLIFGCLTLGAISLTFFTEEPPVSEEPAFSDVPLLPSAPAPSPLSVESSFRPLADIPIIFQGVDIVDIARLGDTLIFVSRSSLFVGNQNGGNGMQVPYPEGFIARTNVAMPDINLLFLLGEDNRLFSFAPTTGAFTPQTISLPDTSSINDLAAASTYLYISNHQQDSILRFPRVEGGFGGDTEWLKQSVPIEADTKISVSDSIYLVENSGIRAFFRGTPKDIAFAFPVIPLSITDCLADTQTPSLFVLDGINGRIVEYQTETGVILNQYGHDTLKGSLGFAIDPATRTAFVARSNSILLVEMR